MKRLFTAIALLGALLAAAEEPLTDAIWAQMKREAKERQRLVIYDNDSDDATCFPKGRPVTPENYLALRTSFLHKYPVDTIVCTVTYGAFDQVAFESRKGGVLADFSWEAWNPETQVVNIIPELVRQGTGVLEEQIKYARAHGIEFFAGIRVNDVHDVIDKPERPVPFFSKWKRDNPQLLLGRGLPWADWSALDFAHQEVRDKFVAVLTEIAERYPVDGLSIDLQRTCRFFKSAGRGEMPSAAEVEMLSEMFRRLRQNTERIGRKRGRPVLLAVRGLDSIGYSLGVGFDWEGLMKEGVIDIFIAGGTIHLEPWAKSVALCHKYGVKCYASIDDPLCGFTAPRLYRTAPPSYFARIAAAYQQGVDGIYYFNLFNEGSVRELMFGGPEKYRDLDKRYHLNPTILWPPNYIIKDGIRFNKFPLLSPRFKQRLAAGKSMDFVVEFGDDIDALVARGFPVAMEAVLIAQRPADVEIASNGIRWSRTAAFADTGRYDVPRNAFRPGLNTVTLTNTSRQDMEIVDCSIDLNLHPKAAEEAPEEIAVWENETHGQATVFAGNYAYQTTPMDAEAEIAVAPGECATVYVSIGGMMATVNLYGDHIEFPGGGVEPVALKPQDGPRKLRFHIEEKVVKVYLDGHWLDFATKSVSMSLRDSLKHLEGDVFKAVRNGGIAVVGNAQVTALRTLMRPKQP